ncbi:hypothetical protein [Pararhizobium gei]|uniref:hypothetical protein n=1 Tax=Pararhizobium gei TaxID=1395951 RepID=UPI0023DA41FC|nr:hypothetical protein [Rhizobium gei]
MNALNHSKFTLSLANLIQADNDACAAVDEADAAGLPIGQITTHHAIMAFRCRTLPEIRAKLAWMTENGTGLDGEQEAFRMLVNDLDALIAGARQ